MTFAETIANSVLLYSNKSNALVRGERCYLSPDRTVTPYEENGKVFLPVDFFCQSIGEERLEGPAYQEAQGLCDRFGKILHIEENGLIAYGDEGLEEAFDWHNHLYELRDTLELFLYDDVSGDELYQALLTHCPDTMHPRLVLREEDFSRIRREIASPDGDAVYKKLYQQIVVQADTYLDKNVSVHELRDGLRLLYVSREAADRITTCAMAYCITQDVRYAECAYQEMEAVCTFPDWNPYHFLDVAVMANGVAFGYDWLYHWMTPDQRKLVREAIKKHAMRPVLEDIATVGRRTYRWFKKGNVCNWRCVVGGSLGCAMLAMMDEFDEEDQQTAKFVLQNMLEGLRPNMLLFAPNGAYEEGYGYWEFAMEHFTSFMKSLQNCVGSDFGYTDVPGLRQTNQFMLAVNGTAGSFNYHNAGEMSFICAPEMLFWAERFGNPDEAVFRVRRILECDENPLADIDILFYNPNLVKNTQQINIMDTYFPVSEIASLRTGWNKEDVFAGFHCDRPYGNGSSGIEHMDAGTFLIHAKGEKFIIDLGSNNYNVSDIANTYRFRAEGHNTIIFNPDADHAMKKYGCCRIIDFHGDSDYAYAIGEMTDAYEADKGIVSFQRGVLLDKKSERIVVQDEITTQAPVDLWWFAHTCADISLLNDNRTAVLEQNGRTLYATLKSKGQFTVMDAVPLPTSPLVPDQDPTDGIRKLAIHLPAFDGGSVCVVFATHENATDYEQIPLAGWSSLAE